MSRYIVAGNWKMNCGPNKAAELARSITSNATQESIIANNGAVVLCPPYVSIYTVARIASQGQISVGAQNCHHETNGGAYTGELTPAMIKEAGAEWVIVGHSERRRDQGETDELVGSKVKAAVSEGLTPIVCIGESLDERRAGNALSVVESQIRAIHGVAEDDLAKTAIAYEPIWAIGTGEAATPEQAEEVHSHVASVLAGIGLSLPILYGGSVKGSNAGELFDQPHINGALVGGAALNVDDFCAIIAAAEERA